MKKKFLFWAVSALVAVGLLAFANYAPFWVSLTTAAAFVGGCVAGWFVRLAYATYFRGTAATAGKERGTGAD